MSRSDDRRREKKAYWRGYFSGKYAEPKNNPYRSVASRLHWDNGYESGLEAHKEIQRTGKNSTLDVLR
jgi:ribosome modulation factor